MAAVMWGQSTRQTEGHGDETGRAMIFAGFFFDRSDACYRRGSLLAKPTRPQLSAAANVAMMAERRICSAAAAAKIRVAFFLSSSSADQALNCRNYSPEEAVHRYTLREINHFINQGED